VTGDLYAAARAAHGQNPREPGAPAAPVARADLAAEVGVADHLYRRGVKAQRRIHV
jgi:hypothetical protein